MKDINTILKKGYYTALNGNIVINGNAVPVYDQFVTLGEDPDLYVIITAMVGNDRSTKNSSDTLTSIQFAIYNRFAGNTTTTNVNSIANQIFTLTDKIQFPTIQVTRRNLEIDTTQSGGDLSTTASNSTNQYRVVERYLTFSHKIFQ